MSTKIAYLDCLGGVSGDMILGALIDAGADPKELIAELAKLNLTGWKLKTRQVDKAGTSATKVDIEIKPENTNRTLLDVLKIIAGSGLSRSVKHDAARVFEVLAAAEGAAHKQVPAAIHFHEVGAVDAILDITGAAVCLKLLDVKKLYASALTVSRPAPATIHILENMSVGLDDIGIENVTPTGAAIIKTLAKQAPAPPAIIRATGYGAGEADTELPNVVRVWLGETDKSRPLDHEDTVVLLESNIDDLTPEGLSYAMARLFEAGALDVWFTPVVMKKGRPANVVSCLAEPGRDAGVVDVFFKETGTLGIRISRVSRRLLSRKTVIVKTDYGEIRVKTGWLDGAAVSVRPEYEDCATAAKEHNTPLKQVYEAALKSLSTR
ncbi:MAG: nickel pincer cofactor biosynthesis protein LarC [Actinomycetota bacterium]